MAKENCPHAIIAIMRSKNQRHRNPHPDDHNLFNGLQLIRVEKAVTELCWLLNHDYARHSAIKLVGDHHQLVQRQRLAIGRISCSDQSKINRHNKCINCQEIKSRHLIIDGFNLIITLEAATAGGILLRCKDACIRDLASVHGTYRLVKETESVIEIIGHALAAFQPASVQWLFDKPVSNSGRLAQLIQTNAQIHHWNWQTNLVDNPDQIIANSDAIAITSDSAILDAVGHWLNLTPYLLEQYFPDAWLIDFS